MRPPQGERQDSAGPLARAEQLLEEGAYEEAYESLRAFMDGRLSGEEDVLHRVLAIRSALYLGFYTEALVRFALLRDEWIAAESWPQLAGVAWDLAVRAQALPLPRDNPCAAEWFYWGKEAFVLSGEWRRAALCERGLALEAARRGDRAVAEDHAALASIQHQAMNDPPGAVACEAWGMYVLHVEGLLDDSEVSLWADKLRALRDLGGTAELEVWTSAARALQDQGYLDDALELLDAVAGPGGASGLGAPGLRCLRESIRVQRRWYLQGEHDD